MIIVSHDYSIISVPKMTDNFIIRPEKVIRVWDITEGKIGIRFISSHDAFKYEITLEDESKNLLARDVLKMIADPIAEAKIIGRVSFK